MKTDKHIVELVVDPNWGDRVLDMADESHVWIIETPVNSKAAQKYWGKNPSYSVLKGITVFMFDLGASPEQICVDVFDTINEHHVYDYYEDLGPIPPWNEIRVVGAKLTDKLKKELMEFGFSQFEETPLGFNGYE